MATPPTDSRQPPDGDEFPDFIDNASELLKYSTAITYRSLESEKQMDTMQDFSKNRLSDPNTPTNQTYLSTFVTTKKVNSDNNLPEPVPIHARSQSLMNLSSVHALEKNDQKTSRWNDLYEQRRKSLSKLKGLVIPEAPDNEVIPPMDLTVNIPEIKTFDTATLITLPKTNNNINSPINPVNVPKNPPPIPPWTPNAPPVLPKYSPAFKRKSLHVYTTSINKIDQNQEVSPNEANKYCDKPSTLRPNKLTDDDLNPPKSLESISSPTRSDCSFDYSTIPKKSNDSSIKTHTSKLEDESDNDSAVSSSQSSFNSRFSPPPSPTKSFHPIPFKRQSEIDKNLPGRLLNASSTEAINRRNILASARCSSGNTLLNIETPIESPPLKKIEEVPPEPSPPPVENPKPVKEYIEVTNESSRWERSSLTPLKSTMQEKPLKREFARSTESLPELGEFFWIPLHLFCNSEKFTFGYLNKRSNYLH